LDIVVVSLDDMIGILAFDEGRQVGFDGEDVVLGALTGKNSIWSSQSSGESGRP